MAASNVELGDIGAAGIVGVSGVHAFGIKVQGDAGADGQRELASVGLVPEQRARSAPALEGGLGGGPFVADDRIIDLGGGLAESVVADFRNGGGGNLEVTFFSEVSGHDLGFVGKVFDDEGRASAAERLFFARLIQKLGARQNQVLPSGAGDGIGADCRPDRINCLIKGIFKRIRRVGFEPVIDRQRHRVHPLPRPRQRVGVGIFAHHPNVDDRKV